MSLRQCEYCDAKVKNDHWNRIHAHDTGWYFLKDGRVYCPQHRPEYAPKLNHLA